MGPGLGLALFVHALLIAALAFSVNWRSSRPAAAEAELWAAVPQVAAPRAAEPEPPPQPVKKVEPPPQVKPEPAPVPDAQIAIEKAKEAKREQLLRDKEELARKKKEKAAQEDKDRIEDARKEEEAMVEAREKNIKRILGQAGASGPAESKGTAQQSAAPSADWLGRVRTRVRKEIEHPDVEGSNPVAEVEVQLAADGRIVSRKLVKKSGLATWDDAVIRAIDKVESLPLDNGRTHSPLTLAFRRYE